jgi:hypothetical protein
MYKICNIQLAWMALDVLIWQNHFVQTNILLGMWLCQNILNCVCHDMYATPGFDDNED